MKPASAAMILLLGSSQDLYIAELVTMTLSDGTVFTWTTAPVNIVFSGVTYSAKDALLQLKGTQWRIGVEVDVLKLQIWSDRSNLIENSVLQQAAQQGLLDNALVTVQRLFTATWGDWSAGSVILFRGNVSDISCDQAHVELDIKSRKELLNIPFPYLRYQPACQWPLYGPGCNISPSSYYSGSTVTGGGSLLFTTGLAQADQFFNEGYITFTTGPNTGITRGVRLYANSGGQVLLWVPLPKLPIVGDQFLIYPGCDKSQSTCLNKFNNLINFSGKPYIPIPETAV